MSKAEVFRAGDGRPVALLVRRDFDDFESHPPTFECEAERDWLREHYRVESPELERRAKAHLTADELPLQLTLLSRPAGAFVKPHWHVNERSPAGETRHQVMVCLDGAVRIGVFTREGEHIADLVLHCGDFVLLHEGHSVETLEDGTRILEIKQGPMPANPLDDNVPISLPEERA